VDGPGWLAVVPAIHEARGASDDAVKSFTNSLRALVELLNQADAAREAIARQYSAAFEAFADLLNKTERLAQLGMALAPDYPTQAKYLTASTVIELLENVLDASDSLGMVAGRVGQDDPLKWVRQQQRALEAVQELVARTFPDSTAYYRGRFEAAGLPITAFREAATTAAGGTHTVATDVVRILHISDLHRTQDERVSNPEVLNDLLTALRTLDGGAVDLIVLSGDVTQSADDEEYRQAEAFLSALAAELLGGQRDRIVLAPGNHDVSWPHSAGIPFELRRGDAPADSAPGCVALTGGYAVPDVEALRSGTASFRAFFERFFGRPYPQDNQDRYQYVLPPGLSIGVLALDTTLGMHHMNATRTSIVTHSSLPLGLCVRAA
jgi:hypothetical protein